MATDRLIAITDTDRVNDILNLPEPPHRVTLHRWCSRGVNGYRLNKTKVGGRTFISAADLRAFVNATTAGSTGQHLEQR